MATLKQKLERETKTREQAELLLRCLKWYVAENNFSLPPVDSWVPVRGPQDIGMFLMATDSYGMPKLVLCAESRDAKEEEEFLLRTAYDPRATEGERQEADRKLCSLRLANDKLKGKI